MTLILKALGHPVRLQILTELSQGGEACVCHLENYLGYRQAAISQHLSKLREAGLVVDRREGMNVYYALADETVSSLLDTAHITAEALADAAGQKLIFPPPAGNAATCPCPKCPETTTAADGLHGENAHARIP